MAINVGSAAVTIVPDASRFGTELKAGLSDPLAQAGAQIRSAISDALGDALRNAPTSDAAKSGASTGAAFADTFRAKVDEALKNLPSVKIDGDTTIVDAKLDELRNRLLALSSARVGVDLDSATAMAELDRIKGELNSLARDTPDVEVRANIARAQASLAEIQGELDRINGETATANVKVDDKGSTASVSRDIDGLKASLISLAPAAIPVGAALIGGFAGVSTVLAAAAGGLGVFALGVSGVSDAVKLLGQQQQAAVQDAAKSSAAAQAQAAAERAAAQQITSAEESLRDARRSAAQSAVDAAEKVQQAKQAEADAVRTAADQERSALQQVAQAEYGLAQANQQSTQAQQALNAAREQAARDLESYADNAVDANLNLQQSQLDLTDAEAQYQSDLANPKITATQLQQDALNVAKAKQAIIEAQQHLTQATEDNDKAQAAGVAGSPAVISATQQVADAKHSQQQAALDLANAERNAAETQAKSAESVAKAQQGVRDAVRDQTREQQQSAEQIQRAQQQVAQAMQQAATASKSAGDTGTSALASVNAQLAAVNPATLTFAKFVRGTLAPAFDKLKASAAGGLLPGLEDGLKAMMPLFPSLNRFVGTLASSMGALFDQAGHALTSPFWRQFFDYMERSAGPIIQTLGKIIGNFAQGFAGLVEAFAPMTRMIGNGLLSLSRMFADFGKNATGSAGFQSFLTYVKTEGPVVADTLGKIIGVAAKLIEGLAPLGAVILHVVDAITGFLDKLSPNQLLLIAGGIAAVVAALGGPLTAAAVAAVAAAALITNNWDKIAPVMQPVINAFREIWTFITNDLVPVLRGIFLQAWSGIESAVHTVGAAIDAHRQQLGELTNAFKTVVGFVVEKVLPLLGPILKGAFELLGESIRLNIDVISALVTAFNWIVDTGKTVAHWFAGPFVDFFKQAWSDVTAAFKTAVDWVKNTWSAAWATVRDLITTPIHDAKLGMDVIWSNVQDAFRNVAIWVRTTFADVWATVKDIVMTPIHNAKLGLDVIWGNLQDAFRAVASWVKTTWSDSWSAVKTVVTDPIHNAKLFLDGTWDNVRDAFHSVASWVNTTFDSAWSAVKGILTNPAHAAVTVFENIFGKGGTIRTVFSNAVDAVKSIWSGLENIFKAPIKFLVNTVLDDGLIWAWNKLADILPGVSDIKPITLPKGFAIGGQVTGPGGPRDDMVPAMLSNGEHVWTAQEVSAAGGHAAVAKMRAAALGNDEPKYYADGGAVEQVKKFIWDQNPKPYIWDEAGPNGYDCSGLVSAVYNLIEGRSPYNHTFSTSNEGNFFSPGTGLYTVGFSNNSTEQHTAGNFAGLGFEARDTQEGIIVGKNARPVTSFDHVMHLPAADKLASKDELATIASNLGGITGPGGISLSPSHYIDEFKSWIAKPLNAIKQYAGTPVGNMIASIPGTIAGDMESQLRSLILKAADSVGNAVSLGGVNLGSVTHDAFIDSALKYVGLPLSSANHDAVNIIVSHESGWNPSAVNRTDSNWQAGHPSVGLMQTIQGTFDRWVPNALKNTGPFAYGVSEDPLANMTAGIRYAVSRYGSLSQVPGVEAVHAGGKYVGYDSGGWLEPGPTLTYNGTRAPEAVLTSAQWDTMSAAASRGVGDVHVSVAIGDEAIDPRMVRITNVTIDNRVAGAQHAATVQGHPGGALGALASPHARSSSS